MSRFTTMNDCPARPRRRGPSWPALGLVLLATGGFSAVATAAPRATAPAAGSAALLLCGGSGGCDCTACSCGAGCRKHGSTLPLAVAVGLVGAIGVAFRREISGRLSRRTA